MFNYFLWLVDSQNYIFNIYKGNLQSFWVVSMNSAITIKFYSTQWFRYLWHPFFNFIIIFLIFPALNDGSRDFGYILTIRVVTDVVRSTSRETYDSVYCWGLISWIVFIFNLSDNGMFSWTSVLTKLWSSTSRVTCQTSIFNCSRCNALPRPHSLLFYLAAGDIR